MSASDWFWPSYRVSASLPRKNLKLYETRAEEIGFKIESASNEILSLSISAKKLFGATTVSYGRVEVDVYQSENGMCAVAAYPLRRTIAFAIAAIGLAGSFAGGIRSNSFDQVYFVMIGSLVAPYLDYYTYMLWGGGALREKLNILGGKSE